MLDSPQNHTCIAPNHRHVCCRFFIDRRKLKCLWRFTLSLDIFRRNMACRYDVVPGHSTLCDIFENHGNHWEYQQDFAREILDEDVGNCFETNDSFQPLFSTRRPIRHIKCKFYLIMQVKFHAYKDWVLKLGRYSCDDQILQPRQWVRLVTGMTNLVRIDREMRKFLGPCNLGQCRQWLGQGSPMTGDEHCPTVPLSNVPC